MTDLEAVITASERTRDDLNNKLEGAQTDHMVLALHVAIRREEAFLVHLRQLQRGIYG